jgi:hypothetical protein
MSSTVLKIILALFAVYLFLCGFILAVCVFMSNADLSPEISLDLTHHPLRSVLLVLLVALPFVLMTAIGRGAWWSWLGFRLFSACVAAVGVYCILSNDGLFEAFAGDGALRHGAGMVYAVSSASVLAISFTPRLRQRFAGEMSGADPS